MHTSVIVVSAFALMIPFMAHADGGGAVTAPTVGTANPGPPAAGTEIGVPHNPKPAVGPGGTSVEGAISPPLATGTDTSTAAPGGHAESTKNGALSTPSDGKVHTPKHPKKIPPGTDSDTAK